ncbi:MAG: 2-phospho-L-lactate guanylyltransferase [Tepidiformaceae bacterium]
MPLRILVPVNHLDRAKGRLAAYLSEEERRALALATLTTVLEACLAYGATTGAETWVLTSDYAVAVAVPEGVQVIDEDPAARGLNAQLEAAVKQLACDEVLIVHADLPLLTGEALAAFVESAPAAPSATISPSGDGGTNAMLLRPPGRFQLAYGVHSAAKHRLSAEAARMRVVEVPHPAVALDLDTPDDLTRLMQTEEGRGSQAGQLLSELPPR